MPHQKHAKHARNNGIRADTNNNVQNGHAVNVNNNNGGNPQNGQRMQPCCMPGSCPLKEELIDTEDVGDAVRVACNNELCVVGNWMHKSCFDSWEESVLAYLRSCGRARSWSEKQRLQNLWTKKGYDLAFKACDCSCGKGHLRKDLDYIRPVRVDNALKKKPKKKIEPSKPALNNAVHNNHAVVAATRERRPSGNNNTNANLNAAKVNSQKADQSDTNGNAVPQTVAVGQRNGMQIHIRKASPSIIILNKHSERKSDDRIRANSISSTGSSPPNSASSMTSSSSSPVPQSPQSSGSTVKQRFEFDTVPSPGSSPTSGMVMNNLFRRRMDLSAFNILPKHKQNPYHIKMEDDVTPGSDDVHMFVLNHLGNYKVSSLNCVLCKNELCIFEKYPLIDGTLFLSPQAYDNQALQVISEGRLQYINAVCVLCLEGANDISCAACKCKWDGSSLLLGSMYSYDIFAAMPCCQKRLTCKHCHRAVVDVFSGLQYFSEYSRMIPCPYCKAYDYHFIRPLNETFSVKMSIWH
ncbi:headcase protein homolog [Mya arenaria]|uniref:headcase protein homolog n=1 Tax=Mya arenaria TaxID=6604 RepID=UPI0022E246E9|nr:headcase protein homolog [Mya arenaria]XP_052811903.1 headcase protein homolog [Mya arenaria]